MPKKEFNSVKELLFYSYANLAMAHSALEKCQEKYATTSYMVRAKLFKGLLDGSITVGSFYEDEKIKLHSSNKCSYCGSNKQLSIDHIFPQKLGGKHTGDNLILACKTCNSSKGKKDLMEWMNYKKDFPPLMVLRRYLKLVIQYCIDENLMEQNINELASKDLPFKLECIPTKFPKPSELVLTKN